METASLDLRRWQYRESGFVPEPSIQPLPAGFPVGLMVICLLPSGPIPVHPNPFGQGKYVIKKIYYAQRPLR